MLLLRKRVFRLPFVDYLEINPYKLRHEMVT